MKTKKTKPRILFWDIETSHNIMAVFELFNKYRLPFDNILQERVILCASWRWEGSKKIHSIKVNYKRPFDDLDVVDVLRSVIGSADAIVHHHGDEFDLKMLTARMAHYKMDPLPPIITIDTKKIASRKFRFNSNRLDYLGAFLGVGRKIHTDKGLWLDVIRSVPGALDKMVRYNKGDVVLLQKVYNRLKAWVPAYVNRRLFGSLHGCKHCGSKHIQNRGFQYTKAHKYQRIQCLSCGAWDKKDRPEKL